MRTRGLVAALGAAVIVACLAVGAAAAPRDTIGTTFPPGFPLIVDESLGKPVLGFGAAGPVVRTPVIFLHGNNDTPYPTTCNGAFGKIQAFAQYFLDHGYRVGELWGLGYQGDQCDLVTFPPNRSGHAHSTVANVPDLRRFVQAVLAYTGASKVDIVGHSLGTTLARAWMKVDNAHRLVRKLVGVDGPNHGIINCSPNPQNFWQSPALGGFTPSSAICFEYGSDHTELMHFLNDGDETPGPTQYLTVRNADTSFVFFSKQDGTVPPVPAEDRDGNPHVFDASAKLDGALNVDLVGQGQYDQALLSAHLGILNSPQTWQAALSFLIGTPTAVTLRAVRAIARGARVTLTWRTASELDLAGFHVFRDGARLTARLIAAGRSPYRFVDARGAARARYRLQAVKLDGTRRYVASVTPSS